jgi:hypothetical protein
MHVQVLVDTNACVRLSCHPSHIMKLQLGQPSAKQVYKLLMSA